MNAFLLPRVPPRPVLALGLCLLVAGVMSAPLPVAASPSGAGDEGTSALDEISVEDYLAERREIMVLINAGELGRMSRSRRSELGQSWSTLQRLLSDKESLADLTPQQRLEFYNAQSTFTSIVEWQRENGLICRDVAPTGTRIPNVVCERVKDREARRERAVEALDRLQGPTCVQVNGVGNC